jgi:hypothetical protein
MFVDLYMPSCDRRNDPSIAGFATEKCAYAYVYSQMCKSCTAERNAALAGGKVEKKWKKEHDNWEPSLHPGCACEWEVVPFENFTPDELRTMLSQQVEHETIHPTV